MNPTYSVVLCTHNHADRLERTLADLAALKPPQAAWEFLVVDNGCTDGTPALLARHVWPVDWNVRIIREEQLGLSNARNRGIAEARGDYVIFMDDDETADPDWLCTYERLIRDKDPDAFGGRICVLFEDTRPAWLADERKGSDNPGGEEVEFYRRLLDAGFKVWWTPDAVIHHRIQAAKLERSYFHDLHYRMGRMEAIRKRGAGSRLPPLYLFGQLLRAVRAVWREYRTSGRNATLRKEMNVAYFLGHLAGWIAGPRRTAR